MEISAGIKEFIKRTPTPRSSITNDICYECCIMTGKGEFGGQKGPHFYHDFNSFSTPFLRRFPSCFKFNKIIIFSFCSGMDITRLENIRDLWARYPGRRGLVNVLTGDGHLISGNWIHSSASFCIIRRRRLF